MFLLQSIEKILHGFVSCLQIKLSLLLIFKYQIFSVSVQNVIALFSLDVITSAKTDFEVTIRKPVSFRLGNMKSNYIFSPIQILAICEHP